MKPLDTLFRKNGFDYQQHWRDENYAIYEQWDEGRMIAYEVYKINKNDERQIAGVCIPPSESAPGNNQWGSNAWTVRTLADAVAKIDEMKEKYNP